MKKKIFLLLLTVTLLFTLIVSTFSISTSALSKDYISVADTYSIDIDINDDGSTYSKYLITATEFDIPFISFDKNYIFLREPIKSKLKNIVSGDESAETDNLIYAVRLKSERYPYKQYGYFDMSYYTKDVIYNVSNSSYVSMSTVFCSSVKYGTNSYDGASIKLTIDTKMNGEDNHYIMEREDGTRYYSAEIVFYSVPHTVKDVNELKNQYDILEEEHNDLLTENGELIKSVSCIYKTRELSGGQGFATGDGATVRLLSRRHQSGNEVLSYYSSTDEVLTLSSLVGDLPIYNYDLDSLLKDALTSTEKRFSAIIYFYNHVTDTYEPVTIVSLNSYTAGNRQNFSAKGLGGYVVFSDSCRVPPPNGVGVGSLASWGISVNISGSSSYGSYNQGAIKCKIGIVDSEASPGFENEMQMLIEKNAEIQRVVDTHEETLSNTTFMGSLFYGIAAGIAEFVSLIFGISFMGLSVGHLVAVAVIGFIVFFIIKQIRS